MSLYQLFKYEIRAIFTNSPLLLTVFGGVLFYSFLYPLPYARQLPREQKVIVVNLDNSQLSRRLERMVDATPQVRIVARAWSLAQAEKQMIAEKLAGFLVIPDHFYRDLLQGREPVLAYAGDASYFLVYGTVLEGMMTAGKTLAAEVKVKRLISSGLPLESAKEKHDALTVGFHSLFNEAGGYVNYVIPAVFVLILHQTLIMGAGILAGGQNEQLRRGENFYLRKSTPPALLFVRSFIFFSIYALLSLYYYGPSFKLYDIPRLASIADLAMLSLPFLLSTTFLGIGLGVLLPRREIATLVILLSSMPLVFASGFIWPLSAIPVQILGLFQFIPAFSAIRAFVQLNQMGASFQQILPLVTQLLLLTALYGITALLLLTWKIRKISTSRQRK
ncbi:MAG: ABC transporter permease [Deltaproteobacteria bacterium]|nr:ABC transporter permease [Deltaproteobacteria bacterium]MBW2658971.1 ABC transporter permease [Deltaproteobacteria bacterium]